MSNWLLFSYSPVCRSVLMLVLMIAVVSSSGTHGPFTFYVAFMSSLILFGTLLCIGYFSYQLNMSTLGRTMFEISHGKTTFAASTAVLSMRGRLLTYVMTIPVKSPISPPPKKRNFRLKLPLLVFPVAHQLELS